MPKKAVAKIYGVANVPCIRTGQTDHVLSVSVGDYTYPLHITELWKEVKSAHGSPSGGKDAGQPKPDLQSDRKG